MAKDAEAHAADDRRQRETIDARNQADALVYNVDKMLKEHRSKIGDSDARTVEEALEETRKAVQSGSLDEINRAKDKLTNASHKLAEAMYKSAGAQGGGPTPGGDGASGQARPADAKKDDVVDAEFVDVDDKK
jgi:molecular chaperone DnaK